MGQFRPERNDTTMTVTKRYLILDRTNTAQRPADHGFHGPDLQGDKSPSFLKPESAKAFGDFLAQRNPGARFYLATIEEGVVQYTEPAPKGEWVAATDATEE